MTVTEDAPPIVDTGFDTVPTKTKRTRSAKPRSQPAPENDRRRGPRPKANQGVKFTEDVRAQEDAVAKMKERRDKDAAIATAAQAKVDEQDKVIKLLSAHIEHQKQSPLYQA